MKEGIMAKKILPDGGNQKIKASLKFLKRTKDGEYTEIPPVEVSYSRMPDLHEFPTRRKLTFILIRKTTNRNFFSHFLKTR